MKEENENTNGFLPDGHLDENSIAVSAEWLSGRAEEPQGSLREHLEKCDHCKQAVLEVSEIIKMDSGEYNTKNTARDLFEETCAAKYSPSIKPGRSNQFWRVAAVFLVLITVTAITLVLKPKKDSNILTNVEQDDSTKWPIDSKDQSRDQNIKDSINYDKDVDPIHIESVESDRYAENYVPNSAFEALIGVQFRAGERPEISIVGKDTSLLIGEVLSFQISNTSKEKIEIQIINNKEELLKKYTDLDEGSLELQLDFDPGLYYWKLMGENELHQVGKFILLERDR